MAKRTIASLQEMKSDGKKIVGMVAYDYQMAQILDKAGVDIISVGDSIGHNFWGQSSHLEITLDQMILACRAVSRGVTNAIVNCDFPFGPLQEGTKAAVRAAIRLVKEGGADMVKLDGAAENLEAVEAVVRAGIPVFGQFGVTPQNAIRLGGMERAGDIVVKMKDELIRQSKEIEQAGASILDFTNSGPVVGPEVVKAVSIPVIGGYGGGPWLDGRITVAQGQIGYAAATIGDNRDRYANVASIILEAVQEYASDVRASKQLRGGMITPQSQATPR